MIIPTAIRLSLVGLLLTLTAGCGGKSDAEYLDAARKALSKQDHSSAVIELKSVLQKSPNLGEARYLLGLALFEQGNCPAALLELGKAQDLRFDENLLAPKLARCKLATQKYKEVIQTYDGVSLKPASAQAELSVALALAHFGLNQVKEADAALDQALKATPNYPWALVTRSRMLAADGKFDDALAMVDKAIVPGAPSGDAHLLRGSILRFGKRDGDGAVRSFQQAALDPKHEIEARASLIQMYLSRQQLPETKAELQLLKKAHPKNLTVHYFDGVVSYAAKEYGRAEEIADKLLGLAPTNPRLLVLGGAASLQKGNLIAAETKLGKAVQTAEQMVVARKLLGDTYIRMGRPDKALATLQPLMETAKPDAEVLALAGQAHLQAGRTAEAESMFNAAVKLKPQDVQVRTALALANLVKGNAEAAFETLQEIAAKDSGDTADLALISAHLRRKEYDAALKAIERLEKKHSGSTHAAMLRGAALNGKGDAAGARASFELVLKNEPRHVAAIGNIVKLDLADRQFDAARSRLQTLIDANPRDSLPRMMMLEVRERQGAKPAELLKVVDEALQANSADAAAYMAKMALEERAGDLKAAALTAQLAMSRITGNGDLLDAAGRALALAGEHQQAITAFGQLAQVWQNSPTPYLRQADLHTRRGDAAAANSALARAFEINPLSPDVIDKYTAQAARTGDPKLALSVARQLQRRFASQPYGWSMEGDIHAKRKDWAAALAAYRLAIPKSDSPAILVIRVHAILGSAQGASAADRFASEWQTNNPKDTRFREYLGSQAIVAKNYVLAERRFRELHEMAPNNVMAANNLAWLLAERGDKQAVEMARQALSLAPRSAIVFDTLAKALATQGDLAAAVDAQREAVKLQPERLTYLGHLVDLLIRKGDRESAQKHLAELEKLSAGAPQSREAIADLRRKLAS